MRRTRNGLDGIISGTGAGRHVGAGARRLGERILLFDRGGWLPRQPHDWLARTSFVTNR